VDEDEGFVYDCERWICWVWWNVPVKVGKADISKNFERWVSISGLLSLFGNEMLLYL
jgi:hypothetical protein